MTGNRPQSTLLSRPARRPSPQTTSCTAAYGPVSGWISMAPSSQALQAGREILGTLLAGQTDPDAVAELARGRLRHEIPALREALSGSESPRVL